jgi:hypothetical protein
MSTIATIAIAAGCGAAGAAGQWAWSEIVHLHKHVKKQATRITALELKQL